MREKAESRAVRRAAVLLLAALLLPLLGCAPHEIENMLLMRTLGVDVGTEGLEGVRLTAAAGTREGEEPTVRDAQGDTMTAACRAMEEGSAQSLFFGDVELLLLGEEQAQRSLTDPLVHVARDPALRMEAGVWVVRGGEAAQVLRGTEDDVVGRLTDLAAFSAPRSKTAREALAELARNGCTYLPALTLTETEEKNNLMAAGYGVFRDGVLVGWTDGESAHGVELLLSAADGDVWEFTMPDCSRVALKITGVKTTFAPTFAGEQLAGLRVTCKVEATVAERRGDMTLTPATRAWMEEALAQRVKSRIGAALTLSKALGADFLALEQKAALAAPWHSAKLRAQWNRHFKTLSIGVEAVANIARE